MSILTLVQKCTKIIAMLDTLVPKLPMREKAVTKKYYIEQLGFTKANDYGDYLLLKKDKIENPFFEFKQLAPK